MKLRKKVLFTIGSTIACLLVILYLISQLFIMNSFIKLEEENTRQNVERALNIFAGEISTLDSTTHDWAAWDDTYSFIENPTEKYILTNLVDETFVGLRLNLMLLINSSGQIVFGKAFDLQGEEEIPVPQSLLEHLAPSTPLVEHTTPESNISGILILPEGPLIIASRPILTSTDEGPVRGTLIMGRFLDAVVTARFAEITQLPLTLHPFNDSDVLSDLLREGSLLSESSPIFIQPQSDNSITGYALIEDIYGNPGLVLKVDLPREIYEQGRDTMRFFIFSLLAVGLVFGLVVILLLEKQVLSRLTGLSHYVSSIGNTGDPSARMPVIGRDELSSLAGEINGMLETLGQSQLKLRESEDRFREIAENAQEWIWEVNAHGLYTYASPVVEKILGYKPEEVVGKKYFYDLFHPGDREELKKAAFEVIAQKHPFHEFINRNVRKDGETVWLSTSGVPIPGERGNLLGYRGANTDITERKQMEEELRESEEKYRTQFEEALNAIYVADAETGIIIDCNRAASELVGRERSELVGQYQRILHPQEEIEGEFSRTYKQHLKEKEGQVLETKVITKKGEIKEVAIKATIFELRGKKLIQGIFRDITEQKKADERIKRLYQRTQDILEKSPFGIYVVNSEGTVDYVNPAMIAISGDTEGQFLKINFFELPTYEMIGISDMIRSALEGRPFFLGPIKYTSHFGKKITVRNFTGIPFEEEGERKVLIFVEDITERKRVEDELRKSEEKYRSLVESAEDSIYLVDRDCRYLFVNDRYLSRFGGLPKDKVIGRVYGEFHSEEEPKEFAEKVEEVFETGKSVQNEHRSPRDNRYFFRTLSPVKDFEGRTIAVTVVSKDITELKQMEKKLKEERDNLNLIFESMPDGVYLVSEDYEVEFMNKILRDEFGDQVGGICYKVFHDREEPCLLCKHSEVMEGKTMRWEWHSRKKNKTYDLIETPLRNIEGNVSKLTIFRDITERKRGEDELKSYMKELERVNRDLEEFTSGVSHDLKAPLRSIQAFSMLLMEDYADKLDETGRDYLSMMRGGTERMNILIDDLLKLSRVGRKFAAVETVDLNELLEEIKSDLRARIWEKGGEIIVLEKLPTLPTQRVWMKELFMNLIDNGLKYNMSEKPRVEVSCEERGEDYLFKVKDNGIGIEKQDQAKIFDPFERLHSQSEYEGTGLGLAICKKIMEELGGSIQVESKPGEGSTFLLVIPRT